VSCFYLTSKRHLSICLTSLMRDVRQIERCLLQERRELKINSICLTSLTSLLLLQERREFKMIILRDASCRRDVS